MKKTFTKVASVLFLAVMAMWTSDAFAGCNDPAACNYVSTDTDALDCNINLHVLVGGGTPTGQSWFEVVASDGLTVVISGNSPYDEVTCVPQDCYTVRMYDVGGDGWSAGKAATFINDDNATIYGTVALASGYEGEAAVTVGTPACLVIGCSDPNYCNYDSTVNVDDGSCTKGCWGCVDSGACNFDSAATLPDLDKPDGGCNYDSCLGCTKPAACNYEPAAVIDDGSCCVFTCFEFGVTFQGTTTAGSNTVAITVVDLASGNTVYTGVITNNSTGSFSLGYTPGPKQIKNLCLPDGCYEARLSDNSSSTSLNWQSTMSAAGSVFADGLGSSVAYNNNAAKSSNTVEYAVAFTIGGGACAGCTDSAADNYNPFATIADNAECCYGTEVVVTMSVTYGDISDQWILYNENGDIVMDGDTQLSSEQSACLPDGCYRLWLNETGTNSWNRWSGAVIFSDNQGNEITRNGIGYENTAVDGLGNRLQIPRNVILNFGAGSTCVPGCTDSAAGNYDSAATWDDGTCVTCAGTTYEITLIGQPGQISGGPDVLNWWNQGAYTFRIKNDLDVTVWGPHVTTDYASKWYACLPNGCYKVVMDGSGLSGKPNDAGWEIRDFATQTLVNSGIYAAGQKFDVGGACVSPINGCIDSAAANYNPQADTQTLPNNCVYTPANDLCVDAIDVTCGNTYIANSATGTFDQIAKYSGCNFKTVIAPGLWYKYNALATERVSIRQTNTNGDGHIFIYTGSDCSNLTCVEGDKDRGFNLVNAGVVAGSQVFGISIDVVAGNDYYLYISSGEYSTTPVTFEVSCEDCSAGPVNGTCANAIPLSVGVVENGNLCCAPIQNTGQNLNSSYFNNGTQNTNLYGVWYSISTGDADAWQLVVNNLETHGLPDYYFSVMYKDGCDGLMNVGEDRILSPSNVANPVYVGPYVKRTDWDANAELKFLVGSNGFELCGDFDIRVDLFYYGCTDADADNYDSTANEDDGTCTYSSVPANDLCADAIQIYCGNDGVYSWGNPTTTGQFTSIASCNTTPGRGTWFKVVGGAADSLMTISTCGSVINSHLNIYRSSTSDCSGTMTCLSPAAAFYDGCNETNAQGLPVVTDDETIDVLIVAGSTNYIYVTNQGTTSGSHTLTATCAVPVIGCTDAAACNYDSANTIDDGSCTYPGCDDTAANNYEPEAGCLEPGACCYDDWVTVTITGTSSYMGGYQKWGVRFFDETNTEVYRLETLEDASDLPQTDPNYNIKYVKTGQFCFPEGCYNIKPYVGQSYYFPNLEVKIEGLPGGTINLGAVESSQYYTNSNTGVLGDNNGLASPVYTYAGAANCGCGDIAACNYDSTVTNNGDCNYTSCVGCTDSAACNYEVTATVDSGECCFENCVYISIDVTYTNAWFDLDTWEIRDVTNDVVIGTYTNAGSSDLTWTQTLCIAGDGCYALNWLSPNMQWLNGSFGVTVSGPTVNNGLGGYSCTLGNDCTGNIEFTLGAGNCNVGCAYEYACNYDSTAGKPTYTNDVCDFSACSGCTYPDADNYDSTASLEDGSCIFTNSCPTDLDGNNQTGVSDLLTMLTAFGSVCP